MGDANKIKIDFKLNQFPQYVNYSDISHNLSWTSITLRIKKPVAKVFLSEA